jgi:hypothetical protein
MVKIELYVPGIKSHEMVDIAHCEIVEGSRGKRHRLYGTYTDPATKKIHKVNSFATKAKYDKAVAEMTEGMPVEDITITQISHFAEDSPLEADASELGGPTEPDNAGVPVDVGGDKSVPMGDEPRDIQEIGRFDAESIGSLPINDNVDDYSTHLCKHCGDGIYYHLQGGDIGNQPARMSWCGNNQEGPESCDAESHEPYEGEADGINATYKTSIIEEPNLVFFEKAGGTVNLNNATGKMYDDWDRMYLSEDGQYVGYHKDLLEMDTEAFSVENKCCNSCPNILNQPIVVNCDECDGGICADCEGETICSICMQNVCHSCSGSPHKQCTKWANGDDNRTEQEIQAGLLGRAESFSADDRVTRPEAYDKVYNAIDFIKRNNLTVTLQEVGNQLHDDGYMTNDEKEAFYYIMDQKNAETSEEVRSWESIAMDMINPDNITSRDLNAEMTLREWGESEIEESKHDFAKNPNEPFREWLDEEVKTHGDITFKEWADEEETETMSAEQITKSAESDTSQNTIETQVAVGLGIPPEIWLSMPRSVQDEYISSMDLDVMYIRELAQNGGECDATGQNGYGKIMELANSQKQDQTSGDLSLIECNVCGISASQLLQSRGGVCEITDPMLTSAGEANPNYLKGVSCPFEKYYSLTQAVDTAVDREREENRTVIQLVTPRSVAYAAEDLLPVAKVSQVLNTFAGQRISKHAESAFDKVENKIADKYEKDGMSREEAERIGASVAYKQGVKKYGKNIMTEAAQRGVSAKSVSSEDTGYECSCEVPRPRHAGVHPTVCQYCNLIIEAETFDAETFESTKGIDTFIEPFEDDDKNYWLKAIGLTALLGLAAYLLPKEK